MIERLHHIARALRPLRGVLLILAGLSLAVVILSLVDNPWIVDDNWLMPGIAAMLWWLNLYSLSFLFLKAPPVVDEGVGWRQRLSRKIRRAAAWVAALLFLLLTVSLLILTYQLLRVALF